MNYFLIKCFSNKRKREKNLIEYVNKQVQNKQPLLINKKDMLLLSTLIRNGNIQIPAGTVALEVE